MVEAAPEFEPGEEVVLFVTRQGDRLFVNGLEQGVQRVLRRDGETRILGPDLPAGGSSPSAFYERVEAALASSVQQGGAR